MRKRLFILSIVLAGTLLQFATGRAFAAEGTAAKGPDEIPTFKYDPDWPKVLPNFWIVGNIGSMYMDKNDHLWIAQRPNSTINLGERDGMDGQGECCYPAPPIMEFDYEGNLVRSWGPIHVLDANKKDVLWGKQVSNETYPDGAWPSTEHGLYIDDKNNLWLTGNNDGSPLLKLTKDGKLIKRFGTGESKSSNDKVNLAGPTQMYVDSKTNEIFVADGYRNRRIVVFDADTGAYKRHWGAYGKAPPDGPQQLGGMNPDIKAQNQQFSVVHCLIASKDGLLYVCDRANSRIQVFQKSGKYMGELFLQPTTKGIGTAYAASFSPDEKFLYVGDGSNKKVHIVRRADMKIVGSFGTGGRSGGQFLEIHTMTTDSKGNVYVGETINGNRMQRFLFTGMKPVAAK